VTPQRSLALALAVTAAVLAACGGGGGGGTHTPATPTPSPSSTPPPTPTITMTPTPVATGTNAPVASSIVCSTAGAPQSVARAHAATLTGFGPFRETLQRRMPASGSGLPAYRNDRIAVEYPLADPASTGRMASAMSVGASGTNAFEVQNTRYDALGRGVRILSVDPKNADAQLAALRAAGFNASYVHVARTTSTNAAYGFTNDVYYYPGLPGAANPLYQASYTGGQWDMHVICLANAWAYAQPTSAGGVANNYQQFPAAVGDPSIQIAIIDTGVDPAQPELAGKLAYTETDVNATTAPNVITDTNGHGTNVSGIAAADTNNSLAFVGAGNETQLMAFQVFPNVGATNCPTADNCTADTGDIAIAVNNAVRKGASVISMSLGVTGCPSDAALQPAIANAIANNVTVVAAAGNESANSLDAPGCYTGVIPVGASSLVDSGSSITEAVASYSNWNASNAQWGVVAPGGDPSGNNDNDYLHWIEHIWSSVSVPTVEPCSNAYDSTTPVCRILIAGTSQATPHVAGAAALLIAVAKKDLDETLTPAQVFNLLCTSAKSIGDPKQGCGRLDVYHAMATLVKDPKYP
jgi:subtilisin family serine protease